MFKAPNNIYRNWNKALYIASKNEIIYDEYNNEIVTYKTPFYFGRVNYQPLNRKELEAFVREYGETDNQIISLLIDEKDKDKIKKFDKAYLYGANPDGEEIFGENANFVVKAFKPQNTRIMILFEELIKEE